MSDYTIQDGMPDYHDGLRLVGMVIRRVMVYIRIIRMVNMMFGIVLKILTRRMKWPSRWSDSKAVRRVIMMVRGSR